MTVLNPFRRVDERIMDDADLAGPLIFCFCFATFLLFVRVPLPHGASSPLTTCIVWQTTVRVYLWARAIRLHQPLLPSKPYVRAGYRRLPRALRARVLFAAHGWRRCAQCHCHVGVRKRIHPCWHLVLMLSFTAACWVTCFPPYPSSGVHTPHLASSLPFFACQISVF